MISLRKAPQRKALSRSRRPQAGFTLIEVVVALGVFSIAALGLIHAMGEQARAFAAIQEAALARFVADNEMALAMVDPSALQRGSRSGVLELADNAWAWTRTTSQTDDAMLMRITITVAREDSERVLAEAVAFRSLRDLASMRSTQTGGASGQSGQSE